MKRRTFISKTTLAALAAPFLPVVLAEAKPLPTFWACYALPRSGAGAVLHTNYVDDVLLFIDQFDEDKFYRIEIYANGKLFMSHNLIHSGAKNEWIPRFYKP
jgi:hypothetical protein